MRGVFSFGSWRYKAGEQGTESGRYQRFKKRVKKRGAESCLPSAPRRCPPLPQGTENLGLVEEILVYARELSVVRAQRADASEATTPHSSGDLPAERTPRSSRKTRPPEGTLRS